MSKKSYSDSIFDQLSKLPYFCNEFIFNFGELGNYSTQLEYLRDIHMFLLFLTESEQIFCEKKIKDLTLNDLSQVTPLMVNHYLSSLEVSGRKLSTVKRKRASISSLYNYFCSTGLIPNNPVLGSRRIRIPEKDVIYLTIEEQKRLLDVIRYGTGLSERAQKTHNRYELRDVSMFLLMLDTGLRVSEMLNTDIIDYDFELCKVLVVRKGGDKTFVDYSDECCEALKEYVQEKEMHITNLTQSEPMFTTTTGNRLTVRAVEKLTKKYVWAAFPQKAKIISPHKLRSSFAMAFYRASDKDLLLLKEKMGHKSINTTNIYAKATKIESERTRNLLQSLRNS